MIRLVLRIVAIAAPVPSPKKRGHHVSKDRRLGAAASCRARRGAGFDRR